MFKEAVKRAADGGVHINKQRTTFETVEILHEHPEFRPGARKPHFLSAADFGNWKGFDTVVQTIGAISQANKAERPSQVGFAGVIEHVHIVRAEQVAPLHT